jgi:S1-C subfamily serine protease
MTCTLKTLTYGVPNNKFEALRWYLEAAEKGFASSQFEVGSMYGEGIGVSQNHTEAVKWLRRAAEQGNGRAQNNLGTCYHTGMGVPQDFVESYKWYNLAAAQDMEFADRNRQLVAFRMTAEQIAEAQRLSREFKPRLENPSASQESAFASIPKASDTGFFITEDGYLITNEHVAGNGAQMRWVTETGIISAKVVKVDMANDLALLKADGQFTALPIVASRTMRMGSTVATVGFPNIGLQGFASKLAKGEVAALTGAQDDPRYFQISVPVQPGNSGGALVDEHGNVVGVVSAKLNVAAALATSGALPENVNYAVKSSFLLSFLESVPEVSAKLKEANTKDRKFEDVVKSAEKAAVLVLVY